MSATMRKCAICQAMNDPSCLYCTSCGKSLQSPFAGSGGAAAPEVGPNPSPEAASSRTEDLLQKIAVASDFPWEKSPSGFRITVPLGVDRRQNVHVVFSGHDDEGHDLISFVSICGKFSEKHAATLLRFNCKLTYGAFGIKTVDGEEFFVVTANQPASVACADGIRRVLIEIARRADAIEAQLSKGQDVF